MLLLALHTLLANACRFLRTSLEVAVHPDARLFATAGRGTARELSPSLANRFTTIAMPDLPAQREAFIAELRLAGDREPATVVFPQLFKLGSVSKYVHPPTHHPPTLAHLLIHHLYHSSM